MTALTSPGLRPRLVLSSLLGVNDQYLDMSRQMLLYYRQWPISEFVLTLNGGESEIRSFRQFIRDACVPATVFNATKRYDNRLQARWSQQRQAYIQRHYEPRDWKLCVDSDEIIECSDALLHVLDTTCCAYFLAFTVDMIPIALAKKTPVPVQVFDHPHGMYFLTQAHALAQKVPLARAHVLVEGAAHNVTKRNRTLPPYEHVLPLYHYKWETGVQTRLRERFEYYSYLGLPYAEESLLFCKLIEDGISHLRIDDLNRVRLSIKPDKTGDMSLQLDHAGHLTFFSQSGVLDGLDSKGPPTLSKLDHSRITE